jgi:hypothetical protein
LPKSLKSVEEAHIKEISQLTEKHMQKERDREEKERIIIVKE